jgi:hypothetical protein
MDTIHGHMEWVDIFHELAVSRVLAFVYVCLAIKWWYKQILFRRRLWAREYISVEYPRWSSKFIHIGFVFFIKIHTGWRRLFRTIRGNILPPSQNRCKSRNLHTNQGPCKMTHLPLQQCSPNSQVHFFILFWPPAASNHLVGSRNLDTWQPPQWICYRHHPVAIYFFNKSMYRWIPRLVEVAFFLTKFKL